MKVRVQCPYSRGKYNHSRMLLSKIGKPPKTINVQFLKKKGGPKATFNNYRLQAVVMLFGTASTE